MWINVIDNDFFERIQSFRDGFRINKKIIQFIKYLDLDLKNILSLSMYTKHLFDDNRSKEALKIKDDIGDHYGKEGRKLCNLYLSGYIDGMVEYLEVFYENDFDKIQREINGKIKMFVKESDNIFFIHSKSNKDEIINEILKGINLKEKYIALHGAGSNIQKVKIIQEEIKDTIIKEGYDISEENLNTLSMCPILNICITKKD